MRFIPTLVLFAVLIQGCTSAEYNSINRSFDLRANQSKLIDIQ